MTRSPRRAALALALPLALAGPLASASPEAVRQGEHEEKLDRVVARFYAPETGGPEEPRFVTERSLGFEARVEVMIDRSDGLGEGYDEREIHAALDRHVSEEMLAGLAGKLIAGSPPWQRPSPAELAALQAEVSAAMLERLGGAERVRAAAEAEQLNGTELDAVLRRQAYAVWYLERAVTPIREVTDEQLREVFRTATHPYRGQTFEHARAGLRRWFAMERFRAAENAFLQSARSRVHVVVEPVG